MELPRDEESGLFSNPAYTRELAPQCPYPPETLPSNYFKVWIFIDPNRTTMTHFWAALVNWQTARVDCNTWRWIPRQSGFPCGEWGPWTTACGRRGTTLKMWEDRPWGSREEFEKFRVYFDHDYRETGDNPEDMD